MGPFILFPLLFLITALVTPTVKTPVDPLFAIIISLAVIGAFLIAMLIGWVKKFPRWVFPYWGFIVLVTIYVYNFTGTMAGYQVRGDWWAWMPIVKKPFLRRSGVAIWV